MIEPPPDWLVIGLVPVAMVLATIGAVRSWRFHHATRPIASTRSLSDLVRRIEAEGADGPADQV